MEKQQLKSNKKRAEIAKWLIYFVIVLDIVLYFNASSRKLSWDDAPEFFVFLYIVLNVISVMTFIRWFRRAYYNLHLFANCKFTDGWAAGAWFVPVINLFRPYQIMKEMWEKIQKVIKEKSGVVTKEKDSTIISAWWILFLISNIIDVDLVKSLVDIDFHTMKKLDDLLLFISMMLGVITVYIINVYSGFEDKLEEITSPLMSKGANIEHKEEDKGESEKIKDINNTLYKPSIYIMLIYSVIRLFVYLFK